MKNVAASSLVIGLEGLGLTQADEGRLKHPAVGGVILFARNYESPAQLKKLCESVKSIRPDLQIVVDQEGGRVQRFKEGFSALPAARAFGDIYDKSPVEALSVARQTGQLMASELRACGVDVSLAPVVDLGVNQEVIGSRAFHRDPNIVAVLAGAFIAGMNTAGMPAVIKHFPGHG
ncbi:MAG: beta-N-acetylhexosaminidase, partial [Gammaproteobacteria bacterium]|nr:beta-N-acetylhexosaminidase [Gammaproteobacteria bacterium]